MYGIMAIDCLLLHLMRTEGSRPVIFDGLNVNKWLFMAERYAEGVQLNDMITGLNTLQAYYAAS